MARSKTTRVGNGSGHGAGAGDGWGGPSKGATSHTPAPRFELGNVAAVGNAGQNPSDLEKAKILKDRLFQLANTAERQETQVRAAEAWLNRHEGAPVARTINHNADDISALDDAALAARREALERAVGSGAGGTASSDHTQGPGPIRH